MISYAEQTTDIHSLGAQVAEYKPRSVGPKLRVIFGLPLSILGVFLLAYGGLSSQIDSDDRAGMMIVGALLAIFGWVMIEFWIKAFGLRVQVFTDGIVRSQYGKNVVMRWDEITNVWQQVTKHYTNGIYTGTTHVYTVQKADNVKVKFDDALKNIEQLGDAIQNEVSRRLLPQVVTTYNNGGTVKFGKLAVSPLGLNWEDKLLPWNQVEGVQIARGYLTVKQQGKWLRWLNIRVSTVPNLWVAITLIDRIVGVK